MQCFDISNLGFNQIKIFITVAECGSFSDAAKLLNYSQSRISKTILGLENNFGLPLFSRNKSQNILTDVGKILYRDFKKLFKDAQDAVANAFDFYKNSIAAVRVGLLNCVTSRAKLAYEILKICNLQNIVLQYCKHGIKELFYLGQQKKLDVIITSAIDRETLKKCGYNTKILYHTKAAIFVPKSNPLYNRKKIDLSELAHEKFIMISPVNSPNYLKYFTDLCKSRGFTPNVAADVANTNSYLINMLSGRGIVFADAHTDIVHKDIKRFVLEDINSDMVVAWLENDTNQNLVKKLVEIHQKE